MYFKFGTQINYSQHPPMMINYSDMQVVTKSHIYSPLIFIQPVVKVVMCSRGGSASEVETHKNIDSVLHTKTTFQAHSIFSVSIQK